MKCLLRADFSMKYTGNSLCFFFSAAYPRPGHGRVGNRTGNIGGQGKKGNQTGEQAESRVE